MYKGQINSGAKGSVRVLFWKLHHGGERGRKGREGKFQRKAHCTEPLTSEIISPMYPGPVTRFFDAADNPEESSKFRSPANYSAKKPDGERYKGEQTFAQLGGAEPRNLGPMLSSKRGNKELKNRVTSARVAILSWGKFSAESLNNGTCCWRELFFTRGCVRVLSRRRQSSPPSSWGIVTLQRYLKGDVSEGSSHKGWCHSGFAALW